MNITLPPLDNEQKTALTQLTDAHNTASRSSLTEAEYLTTTLVGILNDQKRRNIELKGEQIIAAAKSLSDDKRLQFTAAVEAAYATASA